MSVVVAFFLFLFCSLAFLLYALVTHERNALRATSLAATCTPPTAALGHRSCSATGGRATTGRMTQADTTEAAMEGTDGSWPRTIVRLSRWRANGQAFVLWAGST